MNISVVIPAYNEGASISRVIHDVRTTIGQNKKIENYEIIVVDDGSTDDTHAQIEKDEVVLITHRYRMGYGASLKDGIRNAKHDYIFTIDADDVFPAEALSELLPFMDNCAMAVAARTGRVDPIELPRSLTRWILKKLVYILTGKRVPDLNSGMRIFKKELAKKYFNLISDGFSFTTTLTVAFLSDGFYIEYVPIVCRTRKHGKSKIRPIADLFSFIVTILRTIMYFNPLGLFLPLGILFGIALLISACLDLFIFYNLSDATVILLTAMFFFFSIGLLADLINRRCSR